MNIKTSRKLIKFGNYSLCITLPKSLVRDLKLHKGDLITLEVDSDEKRILINLDKKNQKEIGKKTKNINNEHKKTAIEKPSRW